MNRRTGGIALLTLAGLMLYGFLRSSAPLGSPATLMALLIVVALPAGAGVMLLRGGLGANSARLEDLRNRTIEAEVLRMATQQGGRLTALEVATALALPQESAKQTLDSLVERDLADIGVSDEGVIVYMFHDAKHLGGKGSVKGILDA
jgi:hypothetical protein